MKYLLVLVLTLCTFPLWAGDPRLEAVDALATFENDFSARYTVVHDNGVTQDKRVTAVFRRDKDQTFLILTLEPETSWGKGYLRVGNSLWLYDPRDRQFTLTSAKDRFESSNARLSDFSGSSWARDYRVTSVRQETLGKFDCQVYDLKALRDDVTFPRTVLWVSRDNLVRKSLDYSLSNQLLREVAIPSWQKVGTRYAPVKVLIRDALKNENTQMTITQPSTAKVNDNVYTKEYLESRQR